MAPPTLDRAPPRRKPSLWIPDDLGDDPRHLAAGPLASVAWLYVTGYCHRQDTDGFVPRAVVERYADAATVAAMLAHGLLARFEDGYTVADYLTYQESAQERRGAVLAWHEKKVQGGKASVKSPRHHSVKGADGRFTRSEQKSTKDQVAPNSAEPNTDTDKLRSSLEGEVSSAPSPSGAVASHGPCPPSATIKRYATLMEQCDAMPDPDGADYDRVMHNARQCDRIAERYPWWCFDCSVAVRVDPDGSQWCECGAEA